jgi:flagellar biosynthesis protein FlhF
MQIKRFEAPNMTEALRMIKKEFGPDAVILSARCLSPEKNLFGVKKPAGIEVTAATDKQLAAPVVFSDAGNVSKTVKGQKVSIRIDDEPVSKKTFIDAIQGSLKALSVRKTSSKEASTAESATIQMFKNHMTLQGVEDFFILEMMDMLIHESSPDMSWGSDTFNARLLKVLIEMGVSVADTMSVPVTGAKPRVHVFAGPAGAGKTSAISRLTAIYTRQHMQKVVWITLDTHRVGAVAQSQILGKIFGVPVESASTGKELKTLLKKYDTADHILIDTPGTGIRNASGISDLSQIVKQATANSVYLVVSAATKSKDLLQIVKAYKSLMINSIIVTKLDESLAYGNVFNLLLRSKLPVSFFTRGQAVHQGMENASIEKVLDMLLYPDNESGEPRNNPPGKPAEIIPYHRNSVPYSPPRNHFVANAKSVHFHHADCAWAKRIKPENRIVFETIEEATSRNYSPCKTCCRDVLKSSYSEKPEASQVEHQHACRAK